MKEKRHYPRKEIDSSPRISGIDEAIYRMAEVIPEGPENPLQEDALCQIITNEEIPEDTVDLYRAFYTFTDGNAMTKNGSREILHVSIDATDDNEENDQETDDQEEDRKEDDRPMTLGGKNVFAQPGSITGKLPSKQRDFVAKEPLKDGSIIVKMRDIAPDNTHTFVVTAEAIRGFFHEHPIKSRYEAAEVVKTFRKQTNDFCCMPTAEHMIMCDRCRETINSAYVDTRRTDDGRANNLWEFDIETEDGDVLNPRYARQIRYCAFMEAYRKAMYDATRGGVYEWLYQAISYGTAA